MEEEEKKEREVVVGVCLLLRPHCDLWMGPKEEHKCGVREALPGSTWKKPLLLAVAVHCPWLYLHGSRLHSSRAPTWLLLRRPMRGVGYSYLSIVGSLFTSLHFFTLSLSLSLNDMPPLYFLSIICHTSLPFYSSLVFIYTFHLFLSFFTIPFAFFHLCFAFFFSFFLLLHFAFSFSFYMLCFFCSSYVSPRKDVFMLFFFLSSWLFSSSLFP